MKQEYDCKMCKYYRLEGDSIETCCEGDMQELIPDKRICTAFLEKEPLS